MVEIRVRVEDASRVPRLMLRLAAMFDRSCLAFDRTSREVRITSEWESRAVAGVVDAVESWLGESDIDSATLTVGDRSYDMGRRPRFAASR